MLREERTQDLIYLHERISQDTTYYVSYKRGIFKGITGDLLEEDHR